MKLNLVLLTSLILPAGPLAAAQISDDLRNANPDSTLNVIVQYRTMPTERHRMQAASHGGRVRAHLDLIRSMAYSISGRELRDLAADNDVEHISLDHPLNATMEDAEPAVNANIAFASGYTGTGIGVAVIDSGIMDHPDLQNNGASRVVYNQNFVPNIGNDYFDRYGHGTHIAGIIGGNASQSTYNRRSQNRPVNAA